jgi:SAM-dependent methyltransferase
MNRTKSQADLGIEWGRTARPRRPANVHDRQLWDFMANQGTKLLAINEEMDHAIYRFLFREGLLYEGCNVLDIGSGLGNYATLFANVADRVRCLDISPAMVHQLQERAKKNALNNITAEVQDWAEYDDPTRFDLVFSSFCPALNDRASLLKMERFSQGNCCYISLGEREDDKMEREIWFQIGLDELPAHNHEAILPFNMLYSLGRRPNLRTFTSTLKYEVPAELMVDYYQRHFATICELDEISMSAIEECVLLHCKDGLMKSEGEINVAAIFWSALNVQD